MRFERAVAALAGLVLAGAGVAFVRDGGWPWGLFALPPVLMGGGAVGVAAARGPRAGRAARFAVELPLISAAIVYGLIGVLFVFPALVLGLLAAAFFGFETAGTADARSARILIATGALWASVFGLVAYFDGAPPTVHAALAASLALGLAGLAWLRELRRAGRAELPAARAVSRP